MQRKARLALELHYPRPAGVARVEPPASYGAQGSFTSREPVRKQFPQLSNVGSLVSGSGSASASSGSASASSGGISTQRHPMERTGIAPAEADFLFP